MSNTLCDNKGFSLLEAVIAMFLTAVAIMAVMTLQPAAWSAAGKSDYMGRAAGILYEELQRRQAMIMNPCYDIPANIPQSTVFASGADQAQASGDALFTVDTTITAVSNPSGWRVTTTVTWTGHATGIKDSIFVIRHESFRTGC